MPFLSLIGFEIAFKEVLDLPPRIASATDGRGKSKGTQSRISTVMPSLGIVGTQIICKLARGRAGRAQNPKNEMGVVVAEEVGEFRKNVLYGRSFRAFPSNATAFKGGLAIDSTLITAAGKPERNTG